MNPTALIAEAVADGVSLAATVSGTIKVTGRVDAVQRWQPVLSKHKADVLDVLRRTGDGLWVRRWQVLYNQTEPFEVICHPGATRMEIAALYPGAQLEPIPDSPSRHPTPAEAEELRALVHMIAQHEGWTVGEVQDAMRVARGDPEAALLCFRFLAGGITSMTNAAERAPLQPHRGSNA